MSIHRRRMGFWCVSVSHWMDALIAFVAGMDGNSTAVVAACALCPLGCQDPRGTLCRAVAPWPEGQAPVRAEGRGSVSGPWVLKGLAELFQSRVRGKVRKAHLGSACERSFLRVRRARTGGLSGLGEDVVSGRWDSPLSKV